MVGIHESIAINASKTVVVVKYGFRVCEMLVFVEITIVVGVNCVASDRPLSDSLVGNRWLVGFWSCRGIRRTDGGGV